jgi:adenylyltransferase/sulfurtransferase
MSNSLSELSVAIVGLGGNGQMASELISSHGFRELIIVDGDTVTQSDLERQPLFSFVDIGKRKADVVSEKLTILNGCKLITSHANFLDSYNISNILSGTNFIFDATDSFLTRELINQFSVKNNIPWLMSTSFGSFGQLKLIVPGVTSCLSCLTNGKKMMPLNCHYDGVDPQVPNLISIYGASIMLDYFKKNNSDGSIYYFDFNLRTIERIPIAKNPSCPVCSQGKMPLLEDNKILGRQIY